MQCVLLKKFLQRKKGPASVDEDMLCFALHRFMLEIIIRNQNGGEYAPDTLHHGMWSFEACKRVPASCSFFLNQMKNLQTSGVHYWAK